MRRQILISMLALTATTHSYGQKHWRIMPTPEEIEYRKSLPRPQLPKTSANKTTANYTMPADARIPGEFEESQAVAIAWIKNPVNNQVDVTSDYAHIWAEMADAIQKECAVWIRIENANDSNVIKNYMSSKGTPLVNYRFFLTVGDDFWARDFGPISFYYGPNDDIGIMDLAYYPGRDLDDLFPEHIANTMGYKHVVTNLYAEGGNFITDGFRRSWHSDRIYDANMSPGPKHGPWSLQQIKDTVKYVWASDEVVATPELVCDGGTGHNDMFMKLMDENTYVIMEYPSVVNAQDKNTINNVIQTISNAKTIYGKPFRIFKMPMPTQDNGSYLTSCNAINNDARTFVNGTTVNRTYLMPSYSNSTSGNKGGDDDAIKAFKNLNPGYKVVPIDSRLLTELGGAIHCINMQIPSENPVHFWHPPIQDLQTLKNSFHIISKITNKSGIKSAKCMWRMQGQTTWNTVDLKDSSGYMIGDIAPVTKRRPVEYYLEATTNNNKTVAKPITATTGGYYVFYFETPASTSSAYKSHNFVLNPLPNPNTGSFYIPFSFEKSVRIDATITDVLGNKIRAIDFGVQEMGMHTINFDIRDYPAGMYFIHIAADGQLIDTKKVVKQ